MSSNDIQFPSKISASRCQACIDGEETVSSHLTDGAVTSKSFVLPVSNHSKPRTVTKVTNN